MALATPCFLGGEIEAEADASGAGVAGVELGAAPSPGVSDGDGVGVGVSNGCAGGVGEVLFFRWGEAVGEGVGEPFRFFGVGDGVSDSSSGAGDRCFLAEGVGEGDSDSFSRAGDDFFAGVGVGLGDFFFVAGPALFFLWGFGVGVGVAKIFLMAWPNDCSADCAGATSENNSAVKMNRRTSMAIIGRGQAPIS